MWRNVVVRSSWLTYSYGCREYSSIRVLLVQKTTRVIFLLLEYSLLSMPGCKYPFPVAVFADS